MPRAAQIEFETVTYPQPAPGSVPGWRFPNGTVLVKTFSLDTAAGKKRLETRLLVKNATGVYGVTYKWRANGSDASLPNQRGIHLSRVGQ